MSTFFVSTGVGVTIAIGAVISFFYLRAMALALHKAAVTLNEPEAEGEDAFSFSFVGAIAAVIASSLAIWSYGVGPSFLYVGVALALLSPIAVTYTLYREVRA